jgi:prophage regulatory protein
MDRKARKMDEGALGGATARAAHRRSEDGPSETRPLETGGRLRLLRFPAVRHMTGLSRSTIWRLERAKTFPRHVRLSANTVAWLEDDVRDWIRRKLE